MDRNALLQLVGKLPTEKLLELLSVSGAVPQDAGGGEFLQALEMSPDGDNKITSWNDRTVDYSGGADRPAIADKKWAQGAGGVGMAQNPRMGELDDGIEPTNIFLQTGGGT